MIQEYGTGNYGEGTFGGDAPANTYGALTYGSGTYGQPSGAEVVSRSGSQGWILQQQRKRKFDEERDERDQLRKAIEQAVDPVDEQEVKVVTIEGEVSVVTKSQSIPIPVPPQFDAQAVAKIVASVLQARQIEAQRLRDVENQRRALLALEAQRVENERRLRKRRRDEEILLLM